MSVEDKISCATTCASETDDGDYETSSEGPVPKGGVKSSIASLTSNSKVTTQQGTEYEKDEMSSEKFFSPSNIPTKSESMPVLKSTFSLENTMEDTIAVTSESSLARQRKMKMIVARIDPLLSSGSSQSLATISGGSRTELTEENYQAKKLESRTVLPALQDTACDASQRLKEVTFHESAEDKDFSSQRSSERNRIKSPRLATRDTESQQQLQENGDLIDIAENPHPSIKSFYFPPNPEKEISSASLRTQSRVKDLDTALRIIDELHPLQYQLNEILGQFRALRLANPSLLSQRHHSTQCTGSMSGYYFHRTETFDQDADVNTMHLIHGQVIRESSHDVRGTTGVRSFYPSSNQVPGFYSKESQNMDHNDPRTSSRFVERNVPSEMSNWTIGENESQVTLNNFHLQFGQFVGKDPSGSLIPSVSSSCYRCHRNRARTLPYYDDTAGCSNRDNLVLSAFNDMLPQPGNLDKSMFEPTSENPAATLINPSSQDQIDAKLSTESRSNNSRYSNISFRCPPERSVSSLKSIVSDISRLSRTQYVNSQTSATISKKDQNVSTSNSEFKDQTRGRVTKRKRSKNLKKDLDVQCSGINLKRQNEIVLRQSMESLLKPTVSEESSVSKSSCQKSKSILATDEKVVVVPIIFTDGVPEPKIPMFAVARSRTHLHNVKCHVMNVKKEVSSMTRSSVTSINSTESYERSVQDRSRSKMVSSVSRPSLRKNESHVPNTMKTLSDHHHRPDKQKRPGSMASGYTHSTKAHSEPTKKAMKKIMYGMRSSPEDFAFDT